VYTLGGPGRPGAALLDRLKPQLAHQTHEPLSATVKAFATQRPLQPPSAISAPTLAKNRFEPFDQRLVIKTPRALRLKHVIIESTATDPKGPAQFSATIAVRHGVENLSHLVELLGS